MNSQEWHKVAPLWGSSGRGAGTAYEGMNIKPNTTPAIHLPAPNKDQIRRNEELSGAYWYFLLGGRCMTGGSIGLYD